MRIVEPVAASIAKSSKVLTIGIGASAAYDGQIRDRRHARPL